MFYIESIWYTKTITIFPMLQKILVIVFAFTANFIIQSYGNFTGKLPAKGSYLGASYDSLFIRSIVTQFEYLWVLILINILFTLMFGIGFAAFKNFLPLAIIWLAMGPVAALVFNSVVLKEQVSIVAIIGISFVIFGSVLVVAQKDILALFER